MKSRMFLTKGDDKEKDKIIIETPEVHLTIDEKEKSIEIKTDKGKLTFKTETLSITIDETNKTIKLKTEQTGVTLHDQSGKVIIGDGVQGYQAARMGSLTSKGDVIVGRVATKVLVL